MKRGFASIAVKPLSRCVATLFAQTEILDQLTIAVDVLVVEVLQELAATAYHLGQRTSGAEVLVVILQVLSEVLDAIGEQCHLALNRTGVLGVLAILVENLNLLCLI